MAFLTNHPDSVHFHKSGEARWHIGMLSSLGSEGPQFKDLKFIELEIMQDL